VLVHIIEPQVNIEFSGERYYFEAYFAVLVLAARGTVLLMREWGASRRAFAAVMVLLAAGAVLQQTVAARIILDRSAPYREMRRAAEKYALERTVIFWLDSAPVVYGKHYNLNGPDWRRDNLFYLVDPGPGERDRWACAAGRPAWVTIGYDELTQSVVEQRGLAPCE